jgi:hypothetical protein
MNHEGMIRRAGMLLVCALSIAAVVRAQTPTGLYLYNCRSDTPMTDMIVATDLNRSAAKYKVEFEIDGDWSRIPPIELDQNSRKSFSEFLQLQFDVPYRVRFSVKQSASDPLWSSPGPPSCPFRLRNTLRVYSCPADMPMTEMILANDFNRSARKYRFEFAQAGNWSAVPPVELDQNSRRTYAEFPQLQFDIPYTVRVSVKQNATDEHWALPVPEQPCTFTLRNVLRLYSCPAVMPMTEMIIANDFNHGFARYKVELAENGDWNLGTAIELDQSSRKTYADFSQIRYDTPYAIRISVKKRASDALWSGAGPVCTLRTAPCPKPLQVAVKKTSSECDTAGSAVATVTGGLQPYAYYWSPRDVKTSTIGGLQAGIHIVTVTDVRGCKGTAQVAITTANTPLSLCISTEEATCGGTTDGVAVATASGGLGPYTFSWSTNPAQSAPAATGLGEGSYSVLVTDANGCTKKGVAVITRRNCTP